MIQLTLECVRLTVRYPLLFSNETSSTSDNLHCLEKSVTAYKCQWQNLEYETTHLCDSWRLFLEAVEVILRRWHLTFEEQYWLSRSLELGWRSAPSNGKRSDPSAAKANLFARVEAAPHRPPPERGQQQWCEGAPPGDPLGWCTQSFPSGPPSPPHPLCASPSPHLPSSLAFFAGLENAQCEFVMKQYAFPSCGSVQDIKNVILEEKQFDVFEAVSPCKNWYGRWFVAWSWQKKRALHWHWSLQDQPPYPIRRGFDVDIWAGYIFHMESHCFLYLVSAEGRVSCCRARRPPGTSRRPSCPRLCCRARGRSCAGRAWTPPSPPSFPPPLSVSFHPHPGRCLPLFFHKKVGSLNGFSQHWNRNQLCQFHTNYEWPISEMISLQKNLNKFKAKIRELFFCNVEFTVAWEPSGCPVDPMRPRCGGRESEVSNCKYRGCIPGQITSTNGYQIFGVLSLSGAQCIGLEVRAVPSVSHCIRTEATAYRWRKVVTREGEGVKKSRLANVRKVVWDWPAWQSPPPSWRRGWLEPGAGWTPSPRCSSLSSSRFQVSLFWGMPTWPQWRLDITQ